MSRLHQQLVDISHQIEVLNGDLQLSREQLLAITDMADDARLRAIVSETPAQDNDAHELGVAQARLETVIASMEEEIVVLRDRQDQLLEKLFLENQTSEVTNDEDDLH